MNKRAHLMDFNNHDEEETQDIKVFSPSREIPLKESEFKNRGKDSQNQGYRNSAGLQSNE
jgi:hypothetical protein